MTIMNRLRGFRRVLIAGLIGVSLWGALLSSPAQAADADTYYKNERGNIQATERYDAIQEEVGGMNTFEDTDPRRNTTKAEAKAQALADTAKRRKAQADDPFEPARDAIETLAEKASDLVD